MVKVYAYESKHKKGRYLSYDAECAELYGDEEGLVSDLAHAHLVIRLDLKEPTEECLGTSFHYLWTWRQDINWRAEITNFTAVKKEITEEQLQRIRERGGW